MTRPEDWGYISGVVAALEPDLLAPKGAGEPVSSAASAADLLTRIRRSGVYAELPASGAENPLETARRAEAAVVVFVKELCRSCPQGEVADPFLIGYDMLDLANYLKSKYCGLRRRPSGLSRLPRTGLDGFVAGLARSEAPAGRMLGDFAAAVAASAGSAGAGERVSASTVDLLLDGTLAGLWPELSRPLGSELIAEWAEQRRVYLAVEAVVRAKAAGVEPDAIQRHLLRHLGAPEWLQLADAPEATLRRALAALVPEDVAEEFDPADMPVSAQRLAAALDERLDRVLEPAWRVVCGPERVFVFLRQLFRENRNVRAMLGVFAGRIPVETAALSLRGVYV